MVIETLTKELSRTETKPSALNKTMEAVLLCAQSDG